MRAFLMLGLFTFVSLTTNLNASPGDFSILQGFTDQTSAEFSVLVPSLTSHHFLVVGQRSGTEFLPTMDEGIQDPTSGWAIRKLIFEGLSLTEPYWLFVRDRENQILDQRSFKTLNLKKTQARFALASCMFDGFHRASIWQSLVRTKPDLIFFLGDNVYADRLKGGLVGKNANPNQLWQRYLETRQTLWIFRSPILIPILATWDDHDYGANDSDRTYQFKEESRRIFEAFYAQSRLQKGPGVASTLDAFGQKFILLDGRSFRSPNDDTHWGREQEVWVEQNLMQSTAPVTWLMQGDQFFGEYYSGDSFLGQRPKAFERIMDMLSRYPTQILFASGDRHYSEVQEIPDSFLGYRTWEITSSSMHSTSFLRSDRRYPNPRRIASTSHYNFIVVNSDLREGGFNFELSSWNASMKKNFELSIELE